MRTPQHTPLSVHHVAEFLGGHLAVGDAQEDSGHESHSNEHRVVLLHYSRSSRRTEYSTLNSLLRKT